MTRARSVGRVIVGATVAAAAMVTLAATPAAAYQRPGSTWTWHAGDNRKTGPSGTFVIFEDRNKLRGKNGCTSLTTDGFSEASRGSASGISLTDSFKYSLASVNGFGVSLPAGAGVSTGFGSATVTWTTAWNGNDESLRHDYDSVNGVTNVVAKPGVGVFLGFSHTVSGEFRNGSNVFRVSKNRNEGLC
ncbi:MAG: hypothetical protein ACR2GH_17695 [Pseudonocardia sp.]